MQIAGGLLLATGRVPRLASAVLAATVIPANLGAHMFWNEVDPGRKAAKRRDFLTDISLLGGLIIAAADTAGKPSLGWRGRQAAAERTGPLLEAARDRGAVFVLLPQPLGPSRVTNSPRRHAIGCAPGADTEIRRVRTRHQAGPTR